MKVDRESKVSLYKQVYENLRKQIADGKYKSGELLPSERELGEMFDVDRITVRSALEILVENGLVEKQAGVGTRVKELPLTQEQNTDSQNIIFILPKNINKADRIMEPFNSNLFYKIEKEIRKHGYSLIYTTIGDEDNLSDVLNGNNIRGIMFVSKIKERFYNEARRADIPTVLVNNYCEHCTSVMIDNEDGAYSAVKYLIEKGHKKIGVISGIPDYVTSRERYAGYKKALIEAGIEVEEQIKINGDWTFSGGYEAMSEILESETELPTAIFAFNDNTAFGAIKAIKEFEAQVPEEISIIGFDNIEQCEYMHPPLTSVNVDVKLIGKAASQHLLQSIQSRENLSMKIEIPTKLVVRESVAQI